MRGAEWVILSARAGKGEIRSRRARPHNVARNAGLEVVMVELDEVDLQIFSDLGPEDIS